MIESVKPLPSITITRLLLVTLLLVSLCAGYYHATLQTERKRYARLEDMYVRIRSQLGREETQRLIDLSREQEASSTIQDW